MIYGKTVALVLLLFGSSLAAEPLEIRNSPELSNQRNISMKLLLGVVGDTDNELARLIQVLRAALERSGQFVITTRNFEAIKTKNEIVKLFDEGFPLVIFINLVDDKKAVEWRMYNITQSALMVKGKKMVKPESKSEDWLYRLADELWTELTQQPSSFSSKLAYIKRKKDRSGRSHCSICVCDYDGSHEKEIAKTPGVYVGLYWHKEGSTPRIFCSQFTRFNVQVVMFTLQGKKRTVLNFDGTCVGISLAKDSSQAIYCRSGDIWHYYFDRPSKKSVHRCIIKNDGKNMSPTLLANGDIIFCSDAKSLCQQTTQARGPHICYFHADSKITDLITQDGYCVGPAYCPVSQKIAYSKRINGIMQLCIYDMERKKHEQITFDSGNKIDCSWSPCGNYLLFCYEHEKKRRIAVMHVILKNRYFISSASDECTYPAWSPLLIT